MNRLRPTASLGARNFTALIASGCLVLALTLPALTFYGLYTTSVEEWLSKLGVKQLSVIDGLGLQVAGWQTSLAMTLGMLPVCSIAYALLRARLCFLGFVRGEIFSQGTVRHLGGFACGIFVAAVAGIVVPSAVSVLLTLNAPAGKGSVVLAISSNEVLMLLFAAIVWQFARVMANAAELADEHAQIV